MQKESDTQTSLRTTRSPDVVRRHVAVRARPLQPPLRCRLCQAQRGRDLLGAKPRVATRSTLAPLPDAKRSSRVSPCQKSVILCPTPEVASCLKNETASKGQPAGKEEDSESNDESWPLPVPKSARAVSGRQHHRLRILTDHLMSRRTVAQVAPRAVSCENPRNTIISTNCASDVPQMGDGAYAPSGRRRQN